MPKPSMSAGIRPSSAKAIPIGSTVSALSIARQVGVQLRDHPPAPGSNLAPGVAAQIIGHLSPTLARDVVAPLNNGTLREVDLSQCLSIDSGGIGLMMIALDKGGRLHGCSPHIRPLMQTAYVCHRCASCS